MKVSEQRILVVDDERDICRALEFLLSREGYKVATAYSGQDALKKIEAEEFDLVITDLQMPVMEGNELAVSIKLLSPSLPILMITASERARGDAENPVDALLNKPVTLNELRCAVEKLLSPRPGPVRREAEWVGRDAGSLVCR